MPDSPNSRPRGPISRVKKSFVGTWMPDEVIRLMDEVITGTDSDRSKFVRAAVREKIERHRPTPAAA